MDTPKHLTAIAASKNTAAFGNVSCATAKKDERRWGALAAHKDKRYKPKAATDPEKRQVIMPGNKPAEAIAYDVRSNASLYAKQNRTERTRGNVSIPCRHSVSHASRE